MNVNSMSNNKEFIELILIYLGEIPSNGIRFYQPDPYHLAKWMAEAIYCFKILMFYDRFKISTKEFNALEDICCSEVKCYSQA